MMLTSNSTRKQKSILKKSLKSKSNKKNMQKILKHQERFRSIVRNYYIGCAAALLVYDITNRNSFDEVVNYWYNEVKSNMQNIGKYFLLKKIFKYSCGCCCE